MPTSALKRALQQHARYGARQRALNSGSDSRLLTVVLSGGFALLLAWYFVGEHDNVAGWHEPEQQEVLGLLEHANQAVRRHRNYSLALGSLDRARELAPEDERVRSFRASVLLSLEHTEEARAQYREIFLGGTEASRSRRIIQQYLVSLHRLGKEEELQDVWHRILSMPGVHWHSPLQCPEDFDEALLDGAVPFPKVEGLAVPRLLEENRAAIAAEFEAFRRQPDWDSSRHFRSCPDNGLVQGNAPSRWTEMVLFSRGSWDFATCQIMPTVCRVLKDNVMVEGLVQSKRAGQVSLLKLTEGTTLLPHFGSVNWRYTAHLGLVVPTGVTLHAGDESREFAQGEVLVLDDSFLHSVKHRGAGPRVTLSVHFFHPLAKPMTHEEWLLLRRAA